jgi:flagellar biosynthesis anti-sigma factor FlgM
VNIERLNQNQALGAYAKSTRRAGESSATGGSSESTRTEETPPAKSTGDDVSISAQALLRARATRAAHESPDVREELVDEIRGRVQSGTYEIDDEKIAKAMIGSGEE